MDRGRLHDADRGIDLSRRIVPAMDSRADIPLIAVVHGWRLLTLHRAGRFLIGVDNEVTKPSYRLPAICMPDVDPRSIESSLPLVLGCMRARRLIKATVKADDLRTATRGPRGGNNAQHSRKSWTWQSHAMHSLRWQVWSRPTLLMANPALFQEMRRPP